MHNRAFIIGFLALIGCTVAQAPAGERDLDRPERLVALLPEGALKSKLQSCAGQPLRPSSFSMAHRGAPLEYPEHTVQSNRVAARQGAGILECDVTFTKDLHLVCRHAQDDLASTTNILSTDLASKCTRPFSPAKGKTAASASCRTSDITLAEFRTLEPRMEGFDKKARTARAYADHAARKRTTRNVQGAQLLTHDESITLFRSLGAKFTPELKSPVVDMPFAGMSQQDYANRLVDAYKNAGIPASDVFLQSFNLDDVLYWVRSEPAFGRQAIYIDDRYSRPGFDPDDPATFPESMARLYARGLRNISPPLWVLVKSQNGQMVPTAYAREAKTAGLNIYTWTLERSGSLNNGGGWYYQSVSDLVKNDGATFLMLDALAQDVGVKGVFSDWPATVTYYANCFGLE